MRGSNQVLIVSFAILFVVTLISLLIDNRFPAFKIEHVPPKNMSFPSDSLVYDTAIQFKSQISRKLFNIAPWRGNFGRTSSFSFQRENSISLAHTFGSFSNPMILYPKTLSEAAITNVIISDQEIFQLSESGTLIAANLNGEMAWSFNLPVSKEKDRLSVLASVQGIFVTAQSGHLFFFERKTKSLMWHVVLKAYSPLDLFFFDGRLKVLVRNSSGRFHVLELDVSNGDSLYLSEPFDIFEDSKISMDSNGNFFFRNSANSFASHDAAGRQKWTIDIDSPIYDPVVLQKEFALVNSKSGVVMKVDGQTGKLIWKTKLPREISSSITLLGDSNQIYVGGETGFFILSTDTGTVIHSSKTKGGMSFRESLFVTSQSGNFIVSHCQKSWLCIISGDSFETKRKLELKGSPVGVGTFENGILAWSINAYPGFILLDFLRSSL